MKRFSALIACLLIVLCSVIPSFAYELPNEEYYRTTDWAGLFSEAQIEALEKQIHASIDASGRDLVIVTNTTDEDLGWMNYADQFYDYYGYGIGPEYDGILLFICMEDGNRGFWTSTSGSSIPYFTEASQNYIDDRLVEYLSNGDYYGGVKNYISDVDYLYAHGDFSETAPYYYESGEYVTTYDPNYYTEEHEVYSTEPYDSYPKKNIVSGFGLFSGLLGAAASAFGLKKSMKTVAEKKTAGNYMFSQNIEISNDIYLGTTVSRRLIESDSPSRGSGGSHTHSSYSGGHHSSGGGHHGGGGRGF